MVVKTVSEFESFKDLLLKQSIVAVDIETTGLDWMNDSLLCISFSYDGLEADVVPLVGRYKKEIWCSEEKAIILQGLRVILEAPIRKIFHNGKFDLKFLLSLGDERKILDSFYFDTMLASHLLDEEREHGLKSLAQKFTADISNFEAALEKHKDEVHRELIKNNPNMKIEDVSYDNFDTNILWAYAAKDVIVTYRLYEVFSSLLEKEDLSFLFFNISIPVCKVLLKMEQHGIQVDMNTLNATIDKFGERQKNLENEILNSSYVKLAENLLVAGEKVKVSDRYKTLPKSKLSLIEYCEKHCKSIVFNLDSPIHMRVLLYKVLKFPPVYTDKGNLKTDMSTLRMMGKNHSIIDLMCEYSSVSTFLSTFLIGLKKKVNDDMRVRTTYLQHATATGRLSSRSPNLQNIPKAEKGYVDPNEVRQIFVSRPGYTLVEADFKQIEFRMLAGASRDERLITDINEGMDIHSVIAAFVNRIPIEEARKNKVLRNRAKAIVFGNFMYGRGLKSLAEELQITLQSAQSVIDFFSRKYPIAAAHVKKVRQEAMRIGFCTNVFGRKRRLSILTQYSSFAFVPLPLRYKFAESLRQAQNFIPQSNAADVTAIALTRLQNRIYKQGLSKTVKLLLQIHDAIVSEVKDEILNEWLAIVKEEMSRPIEAIHIPLEVDISFGKNWAKMKGAGVLYA